MVHPVHSAAIDYISGRADSLAFVFSAGAWLLVLRARIAKARWLKGIIYPLAALAGVLALCSREIACIWILIFLVHTLAFARDIGKKVKITTIFAARWCLAHMLNYAGFQLRERKRDLPRTGRPRFEAPLCSARWVTTGG